MSFSIELQMVKRREQYKKCKFYHDCLHVWVGNLELVICRHEVWRVEAVEQQSGIGRCVTSVILPRFFLEISLHAAHTPSTFTVTVELILHYLCCTLYFGTI